MGLTSQHLSLKISNAYTPLCQHRSPQGLAVTPAQQAQGPREQGLTLQGRLTASTRDWRGALWWDKGNEGENQSTFFKTLILRESVKIENRIVQKKNHS